jgi:hypothetical protein
MSDNDVTPDNTRWPQEGLDERPAQLGRITRPEVIQALFETAEALRRVHPVGGDMRIVYAPTLAGLLIVVTLGRPDRDHKWRIFAAHTMCQRIRHSGRRNDNGDSGQLGRTAVGRASAVGRGSSG